MAKTFTVSILCPDQVGLVSSITGKLFELGANLGDTSFGSLGASSEFSTVCTVSDDIDQQQIEDQLVTLGSLAGGKIRVEPVAVKAKPVTKAESNQRIIFRGKDNPGLVAKISQVFAQFGSNIAQLNSETVQQGDSSQYVVSLVASIPDTKLEECKASLEQTASAIGMECKISKA